MGFNLPADWGSYWRTCSECEGRYHASGTDPCNCEECPACERFMAPDKLEYDGLCFPCWEEAQPEDEDDEGESVRPASQEGAA